MAEHDPLAHGPTDNSPLTENNTLETATWSLPSTEGLSGAADARLPAHGLFDYSGGMFVGHGDDANAQALHHQRTLHAVSDNPSSWEAPHEATHRRFEPPLTIPVQQAAAGFSLVAPTRPGLHYVKVIAALLSADTAGTVKFVQGSNDGFGVSAAAGGGDLTGLIPVATNGGFVLPPSRLETPWFFTSSDQSLGIFSVTSKLSGFVVVVYSPYES